MYGSVHAGEPETGRFQLAIVDAERAQQFGASRLEVAKIVRVIDDAHHVGVAVDDAESMAVTAHRASR
jgi:hypothetical protein